MTPQHHARHGTKKSRRKPLVIVAAVLIAGTATAIGVAAAATAGCTQSLTMDTANVTVPEGSYASRSFTHIHCNESGEEDITVTGREVPYQFNVALLYTATGINYQEGYLSFTAFEDSNSDDEQDTITVNHADGTTDLTVIVDDND